VPAPDRRTIGELLADSDALARDMLLNGGWRGCGSRRQAAGPKINSAGPRNRSAGSGNLGVSSDPPAGLQSYGS